MCDPWSDIYRSTLKRAKVLQAAKRLRLGPHYVGRGQHVVVDDAGRPYHPDTLSDFWRELQRVQDEVVSSEARSLLSGLN